MCMHQVYILNIFILSIYYFFILSRIFLATQNERENQEMAHTEYNSETDLQ